MRNKVFKHPGVMFFALVSIFGLTETIAGEKNAGDKESVEIELREWSLKLNKQKLASGNVTFIAHNRGEEAHELVVVKLNNDKISSAELPVNKHGSIDEDNMTFGEIVGEIEDLAAGKEASVVFSLMPGRYAIICNMLETEPDGSMEAHYSQGMNALIEVK